MNDIEILEKLIEQEGECSNFANDEICAKCPMSKLKIRPDGSFYACVDAMDISDIIINAGVTEDINAIINKRYLEAAKRILADKRIEEMLED